MTSKFEQAINRIDELNKQDPNIEIDQGKEFPKEFLYSLRMSDFLDQFEPRASEQLQIAARAQHIARWKIDRDEYPQTRVGYIKWRNELKQMHADLAGEILEDVGYGQEFIDRVKFLILKKKIKKDDESQTLEDVICLVFLEYYFEDFSKKHEEEKLIDIIKKTWAKMSEKGHQFAANLSLPVECARIVQKAVM